MPWRIHVKMGSRVLEVIVHVKDTYVVWILCFYPVPHQNQNVLDNQVFLSIIYENWVIVREGLKKWNFPFLGLDLDPPP